MSCILHLETATKVCSVAVSLNSELIFYKEDTKGQSHSHLLGVFVHEAIQLLRDKNIPLQAVAVSCGPGSYTGLRIGVSEAKGLCYGLDIPLIAIETLQIMAQQVITEELNNGIDLLCPMIDARRMEVYDALFNTSLDKVKTTSANIIDENSFNEYLTDRQIVFFGDGADKCKETIVSENALFLDNIYPRAKDMIMLAEQAFNNQQFVDVAYYEPFYLKEFVGTVPKNKVIPDR